MLKLFVIRKFFPLLMIFVAVLVLYYPSFSVYFSQDDFFEFKVSLTDGSLGQFVNLFGFPSFSERGYAFYRPIFREGLHNLYYSAFGLNVFPMRLLSFLVHFINISLVYFLIEKVTKKKAVAFITAFFFAISTPNVAVLNYLAGGLEVQGATMFSLLSLTLFSKYLDHKNSKDKTFSFVFFILALASHELAIITPLLLVGLIFVKEPTKKFFVLAARELWIYAIALAVFLYLDAVKIGFLQKEKQYQAVFSLKSIINSLSWYAVWALGLPEMLIDFVRPGLKLNPSLMRYWGEYFRIIFGTFFVSSLVIAVSLAITIFKNKKFFCDKNFWFFIIWFLAGVGPVILLPLHKSTHYLSLALPGFWAAIWYFAFSLQGKVQKPVAAILIISLGTMSVVSAILGNNLYWAASRGRLAEKLINDVATQHPNLPKGAVIEFTNDPNYPFVAKEWGSTSRQAAFILNNEDALQLFFKDPNLQVFYEDLGGVPDRLQRENVYTIVARITP